MKHPAKKELILQIKKLQAELSQAIELCCAQGYQLGEKDCELVRLRTFKDQVMETRVEFHYKQDFISILLAIDPRMLQDAYNKDFIFQRLIEDGVEKLKKFTL